MLAGVWQNLKTQSVAPQEAAALAAEWQALALARQEPSGFQGADFALPILTHDASATVDLVRQDGRLVLALPTRPGRLADQSLASDFTAGSVPELDGSLAREALLAFLNSRKRPYVFKALAADSAFATQLQALAPRCVVLNRWQRAALQITGSFDDWQAGNFDHKRRKELKRLHKRLSEQGELKFEYLNHSSDLPRFMDALLELEAQSWKGSRGTALKADPAKAEAFRLLCHSLQTAGTLRFWLLSFDGKPIAALFGKVDGGQGWIIKIAHDEAFARYSPGVLLVMEATKALFEAGDVRLVDSCAIPGHPMIDRLWRDRIEMLDVLVAPAQVSALQFQLTLAALRGLGQLRQGAKDIFYRITRRKRS